MKSGLNPKEAGGWGVDMLRFTTTNFKVGSLKGEGWGVKAGQKVNESPRQWGHFQGADLSGPGYFLNEADGRKFKVEISAPPSHQIDEIGNYANATLVVQVNPSTLHHPYLLRTDVHGALDEVQRGLQGLGIDADIEGANLTRLDIAKQSEMGQPIGMYIPIFRMLQGRRMKSKEFQDGYTIGNGQRKGVFYDKTLQLQDFKKLRTDIPPNVLRLEGRWSKDALRSTKSGPGIQSVNDILQMDESQLLRTYNRFIEEDIFRAKNSAQISFDFETEVEVIESYIRMSVADGKGHSAGWRNYLTGLSAPELLRRFDGNLHLLRTVLERNGFGRKQSGRIVQDIRTSAQQRAFIDKREGREGDFITRNYALLHETFAA